MAALTIAKSSFVLTYFICISPFATKPADLGEVQDLFGDIVRVKEAGETPVGRVVSGGVASRRSYFLMTDGGCSTDLLDRGSKKDFVSSCLLDGLRSAIAKYQGLNLIIHFSSGDLRFEKVRPKDKIKMGFSEFQHIMPHDFLDDVIYVLMRV